jgi:hypothetical protein
MSKEFFASAKFQMKIPEGVSGVAGGLILPSGIARPTLERRNLEKQYPHLRRRLLDPQLYLAGLNVARSEKACANLASYGWFLGTVPAYDSGEQNRKDWSVAARASVRQSWSGTVPSTSMDIEETVRLCVLVQQQLGCEGIILPSPLTTDPTTSYERELEWLEAGLEIGSRTAPGLARIASVAISDTGLRGIEPQNNALIDVIIDQVTAREPEGVYVVIEQSNDDGYYFTHPNTVGSLLRLVHGMKVGGVTRVIVSFAGTAGILALAVGAQTWSTGWYRGERRLRLTDFEQGEGRAYPAYYSHSLAGEFHMDSDLDRVVARGFLERIVDETAGSEGLVRALRSGRRTSDVADWRYAQSNVRTAIEHFEAACTRETAVLAELSDAQCLEYAQRWLDVADRLASDLYSIGGFSPRTAINHQRSWREAFTRFLASR